MKKLLLLLLALSSSALLTYLLLPPATPLSPLGASHPAPSLTPASSTSPVILGFAPYWNLKKLTPASLSTVSHFAYFALHLQGDGSLYTHVNRREHDPGYTNYLRLLATPLHPNLLLTYMQQDQAALDNLLASPTSRQTAITTILDTVRESGATGINIDFEPVDDTSSDDRANFTQFITDLKQRSCPSASSSCPLLTISLYPSAASRPRLWDLSALEALTDYFVVMTYDYTMPKSERSGPNSPLRDFSGEFEHHILKNLGELTAYLAPSQLLLGIPLYGYEWDTLDNTKYSPTTTRGVTASLERIESLLAARELELVWDRNSLTPYGVSTNSAAPSQIYFENETSIRLKLDLVRSAGLGGIALWALGYDNNVPWLWPTLSTLR